MRLLYSFSLLLFLAIVLLQYTSTTTASPIPTTTTTTTTATNNISKRGPQDDVSVKWNHPHGCPSSDDKDKRDLAARGGSSDDEDEDCPTTTTSSSSTHSPTATATSSPDHGYPPSDDPSKFIKERFVEENCCLHTQSFVEDIYGAGYVTPQMGVAGAFLIILGVYLMIFGFRGFRPTLAVSGFLTFGKILLDSSFSFVFAHPCCTYNRPHHVGGHDK